MKVSPTVPLATPMATIEVRVVAIAAVAVVTDAASALTPERNYLAEVAAASPE